MNDLKDKMFMKRIYRYYVICILAVSALVPQMSFAAGNAGVSGDVARDSLWRDAVNAYAGGNYAVAERSFLQLEKAGYMSAELMYNLGNVYFKKDGSLARSILYYERALRLDPSYEDARINLEMAKEFTQDRIDEVPEFVLITCCKSVRNVMSTNAWAWLSIICFVLVAVFLLVFRYSSRSWMRKTGFALSLVCLFLSICAFGFSLSLNSHLENDREAVVSVSAVQVHSSPNNSSTSLFNLHEGTKLEIVEELGPWSKVEISDGRQGWIERDKYLVI